MAGSQRSNRRGRTHDTGPAPSAEQSSPMRIALPSRKRSVTYCNGATYAVPFAGLIARPSETQAFGKAVARRSYPEPGFRSFEATIAVPSDSPHEQNGTSRTFRRTRVQSNALCSLARRPTSNVSYCGDRPANSCSTRRAAVRCPRSARPSGRATRSQKAARG